MTRWLAAARAAKSAPGAPDKTDKTDKTPNSARNEGVLSVKSVLSEAADPDPEPLRGAAEVPAEEPADREAERADLRRALLAVAKGRARPKRNPLYVKDEYRDAVINFTGDCRRVAGTQDIERLAAFDGFYGFRKQMISEAKAAARLLARFLELVGEGDPRRIRDADAATFLALLRRDGPQTPGAAASSLGWGATRAWQADDALAKAGLIERDRLGRAVPVAQEGDSYATARRA